MELYNFSNYRSKTLLISSLMPLFIQILSVIGILHFFTCKETNSHNFTRGIEPIRWQGKIEFSKECGKCHEEIYKEWSKTRHKVSFTNKLYRESHEKEPLTWCDNCHAPLLKSDGNSENINDRILAEEGISCIVCHKRGNKILTSHIPVNKKEHEYVEVKTMKRSEFCANCHQFNFPVGTGYFPHQRFKFSNQPMQNTFSEWQLSYFYEKETCQDCHMNKIQGRSSHLFPGGHNKELLQSTFFINLAKINSTELQLKITGRRIGHAFPTGDLFRTLLVRLLDEREMEIMRFELKYEYEEIEENRNSQSLSIKRLKIRNIITPPVSGENSFYLKTFKLNENQINRLKTYELSMLYTNGTNYLINRKNNNSNLIFKKGKIEIENFIIPNSR